MPPPANRLPPISTGSSWALLAVKVSTVLSSQRSTASTSTSASISSPSNLPT